MAADESPITRSRSCTDIPCLIVFAAFLVGWVVVAGIAMSQGSIKRFTMPSDSDGNICGVEDGYKHKPYLLFFDLTKCAHSTAVIFGCPTPQICVKKCPDSYFFGAVPALLTKAKLDPKIETKLKAGLRYCLPNVNRTFPYARLVDGYHCAPWYVQSSPVAGRCLPGNIVESIYQLQNLSRGLHENLAGTHARLAGRSGLRYRLMVAPRANATNGTNGTTTTISTAGTNSTDSTNSTNTSQPVNVTLPGKPQTSEGNNITKSVLQAAAATVSQMRFVVVHLAGLTCTSLITPLVLSLLFVLLLRWFVGPVVTLVLVGSLVALVCLTAFCGHRYQQLTAAAAAENGTADGQLETPIAEKPGFWLILTIASGSVLLLFLVLVIALRKKILLAVVILEQCSTAVGDMLTLVLVPVISFALQLLICLLFVFMLLFLFGSSHQWRVQGECAACNTYAEGDRCYPADFAARCGQQCPNATCSSTQNLNLYAYNIFALVWTVCFVAAVNQIAVAIAFSTWYFSSSKRFSLALPILAYVQSITFHAGTAAFGSLLIAIIKMIRGALMAAKSRLEKRGGCPARCAVSCCLCCCWCIENVIQFINRRAYIVTALESVGLCTAGRRGVEVVARNMARVAVADSVTGLMLLMGRLLVVAGSVLLCHMVMAAAIAEPVPWLLPALFSAFVAYVVAGTTFSVYSMGVDTIFYCAMVDLDVNDGSASRPYSMSKSLAKALGVTNAPATPAPAEAQRPSQLAPLGPPPGPGSRQTDPDFWSQSTPTARPAQFQHPGEVDRAWTPATPLPGIGKRTL